MIAAINIHVAYFFFFLYIYMCNKVNIEFLVILVEIWKITDLFLFDPHGNSLQVFYGLGNAILKYFTRFDLWNDKDETIKLISWTEQITKTSDPKIECSPKIHVKHPRRLSFLIECVCRDFTVIWMFTKLPLL